MKVILAISSIGGDPRVLDLCRLVTDDPRGRQLFDSILVVDSLADAELERRLAAAALNPTVTYYDSPVNLGSAGNLARRLTLGAEQGADFLFAINQDGDLDLEVVARLVELATEPDLGAVYPLAALAPGVFDLTGRRRFPWKPLRRRSAELPDKGTCEVSFSCSNGALYALAPVRAGLRQPVELWHGFEDVAWGLVLKEGGYRQILDLSSRIDMRYEMRPVPGLLEKGLISDKPPWLSYYFARNLLLIPLRVVPSLVNLGLALVRIAMETAAVLLFRDRKAKRLALLTRGSWDALRGRTGLVVPPQDPG